MAAFTHVIPVGANCRLTHNVRRHFGHAESYPFDWWILPLPALLALLRDGLDPDRLYHPGLLTRVPGEDGAHAYVEHRSLGIKFVHEFPKMPADIAAPIAWTERLHRPRARLVHLDAKLRTLDAPGNALLFVRFCIGPGQGLDPDTGEGLGALSEALARAFPRARTRLLPVAPEPVFDGCETLAVDDRSAEWTGDFALWSAAFASTGHRLCNPALRPFSVRPNDIDAEGAVPEPAPAAPGRRGWLAALARRFRRRGRPAPRASGGPAAL